MNNKNYKEISGCLIELAKSGAFDIIAHGVNCFCTQKSGLAPQMVNAFETDTFKLEHPKYKGDIRKLGNIDYKLFFQEKEKFGGKWVQYHDEVNFTTGKQLVVINAYTQFKYGRNQADGVKNPLDYEALTLCMRKINHTFVGKKIGLPKIGSNLAGGDWNIIKEIIKKELKDCDVTVVIYNKD